MRFTFRMLAAFAAVVLYVGAATATPITSTDGNAGPGTLTTTGSAATGTFIMTWAPAGTNANHSATTVINQSILASVIPTFIANQEFSRVPTSTAGGTQYAFLNFIFSTTFQVQQTPTQTVDFSVNNLVALVPTGALNTLIISGDLALLGNNTSPLLDFSPYQSGGKFTLTFNSSSNSNLNTVIQNGGSLIGTASFSTNAADAVVPEPASLTVFGVLALGGVAAVARRKLLARRGVTTAA